MRCYSLRFDLLLRQHDQGVERVEEKREQIVRNLGAHDYAVLMDMLDERRGFIDDQRPNLFLRVFMRNTDWEAPMSSYPRQTELDLLARKATNPQKAAAPAAPSSSEETANQCVARRIATFRQQNAEAPLRHDVLEEWEEECAADPSS